MRKTAFKRSEVIWSVNFKFFKGCRPQIFLEYLTQIVGAIESGLTLKLRRKLETL